tara:strand:+ start:193 stop:903 length:711 start_codon:yes stop_codon:yes gene_type:complete
MEDRKMSLSEHVSDLQQAVLRSLGYCFSAILIISFFHESLLARLQDPLAAVGIETLAVLSPQEGFLVPIKLVLMCGLIASSPFIVRETAVFIWPALKKTEKKTLQIFVIPAFLMAVLGVLFSWEVLIPISVGFLFKTTTFHSLEPTWTLKNWFTFIQSMMLASVLAFQLPIVMGILAKLKLITTKTIQKNGPYAIIILLIASGLITPPDVVTQVIIAIPLIALFYLSIFIVKINED